MYLSRREFKELYHSIEKNYDYKHRLDGFFKKNDINNACLSVIKWFNRSLDNLFEEMYYKGEWRGMKDLDEVYDYLLTCGRLSYPVTTGTNEDFELKWEEF